jgi:probable rRNA maturation factor
MTPVPAAPDIEIDIETGDPAWGDLSGPARLAALRTLAVLSQESDALTPSLGPVSILLTDDETVAGLNQQFRGKAGPTNVLSFPAGPNPEGLLGDIALAHGVCAREADQQGKTLTAHLQHLVAHGVLHLVGYDHITDDEAAVMEDQERRILASLGVADPYAADA